MKSELQGSKKVRVKRFTPTAQVLRDYLSTGCSEMADP